MGLLLIARDNIKKKKGNTFLFFLLVALSVLLLYVGITVISNTGKVIDQRNAATKGADYLLLTGSTSHDEITTAIEKQKEVEYIEDEKALYMSGAVFYKEGETKDSTNQLEFAFFNRDAKRKLSIIDIIDEGDKWKENSILLPYYMKAGMGYETGDIIYLENSRDTYRFEVYGFTEDIMFATPTNIPVLKCFISSEAFEKYTDEWLKETAYRVRLAPESDAEKFSEKVQGVLNKEIADYQQAVNWTLDYSTMKYGAGITANMFMGVLSAFALILIGISLVIVRFNINNSIEMNMKNIGMLEACGYTSSQLRTASVLEFMIVSILGAAVGIVGAHFVSGAVGSILAASIGSRWEMGFDIKSMVISILAALILIYATVYISCRKYKKIAPLEAMREGIQAHNFKRNHMSLDRTRLPLHMSLGVKKILADKKKSVIVCLIIMILTFCTNLAFSIYDNYAVKDERLIEMTGFETPDITASVHEEEPGKALVQIEEMKEKIEREQGIEQVVEYTADDLNCTYKGKKEGVNCDAYSDTDDLRINNVVEGRRPIYDNEVMLSNTTAERLGADTGDVVYLEMGGKSADYLVTGLSQGINHLGKKAMITKEGYLRIKPELVPELYIYLDENADINTVMDRIEEMPGMENTKITNFSDYISVTLNSIKSVMKLLCTVMLAVVTVVIAMILILLIKTQIVREQKYLGIYKALGYTTGQLMMQITMNCIPVVAAGTLLGSVAAWFGTEGSMVLCLSAFGIRKCSLDLSIGAIVLCAAGIVLWAWLIAAVCSARIRKIVPCEIIQQN